MTEKELLQELDRQEKELVFDSFSNEDAYALGNLIYNEGKKNNLPIAIDITRCGQVLYHVGLKGSGPDNDQWIKRKINTVMRFNHSSYYMAVESAISGIDLKDRYFVDSMDFAQCGGSFPINIKETGTIGTVTVSGLADYDDHGMVVNALKTYLKK